MRIDKLSAYFSIITKGLSKGSKPELPAKPVKVQKSEGPSQKTAEGVKKGLSSLGSKIGNSRLLGLFSKKAPQKVTSKQSESVPVNYREIVGQAESIKLGRQGMFVTVPDNEEHPVLDVLKSLQPSDAELIKKIGLAYEGAAVSHLVFESDLDSADPSGKLKEAAQVMRKEEIKQKSYENLSDTENISLENLGSYTDVAMKLVDTPIFEKRLEKKELNEADSKEQKDLKNAHNYFVKIQDSLQKFSTLDENEKWGLKAAISKTNTPPQVLQKYLMVHLEKGNRENAIKYLISEGSRIKDFNESFNLTGDTPEKKSEAFDQLLSKQKAEAPLLRRLNDAQNKIGNQLEDTPETHSYNLELAAVLNEARQKGIVSFNDKNLPLASGQPIVSVGHAFGLLYSELKKIGLRAAPNEADLKLIELAKASGFSAKDVEGYLIDGPFKRVFDALDRSGESGEMAKKAADFAKRAGYSEEEIQAYLKSGTKTVPESYRKII